MKYMVGFKHGTAAFCIHMHCYAFNCILTVCHTKCDCNMSWSTLCCYLISLFNILRVSSAKTQLIYCQL